MEILKLFKGVIQHDADAAYGSIVKALQGNTSELCWTHGRRPFFKCRKTYPEECSVVLGLIRQLDAIEAKLKSANASPEEIRAVPAAESVPIIDQLEEFITKDHFAATPGNALENALQYGRNCMHDLRT